MYIQHSILDADSRKLTPPVLLFSVFPDLEGILQNFILLGCGWCRTKY